MLDWSQGDLYEGLRCYRAEQFFEAHEHWEAVWLQAAEPEKTFLQALIQVAGAFHHFRRGNLNGARSMIHKALLRLGRYPEIFGSVAVEHLRADLQGCLVALETELVTMPAIPPIELLPPSH
jgi:predicted metal-dependent hydrolase